MEVKRRNSVEEKLIQTTDPYTLTKHLSTAIEEDLNYQEQPDDDDDDFINGPGRIHGSRRTPYKTIALAITLFVLGLIFLIVGLVANSDNSPVPEKDRSSTKLASFILAGLLLTPGVYGVWVIIMIYSNVPGYNWAMIPDPDG
jgi:hypothetical protein